MGTVLPTSACSCTPGWGFWGRFQSIHLVTAPEHCLILHSASSILLWSQSEGASHGVVLLSLHCFNWRSAFPSPGGQLWWSSHQMAIVQMGERIFTQVKDDWSPPQENRWGDNKSVHKWVFLGTWPPVDTLMLLIYWAADHCVLLQPLSVWAPGEGLCSWGVRGVLHRHTHCLCTVLCEQRMRVMREWEMFIDSPYIAHKYGNKKNMVLLILNMLKFERG